MNFTPPKTVSELDEMDAAAIVDGYRSAVRGDPEPGANRGRDYWFGWRNRMMDLGVIPIDSAHMALCAEIAARNRRR